MKVLKPKTVLRINKLWPHGRKQGHAIGQVYRVGYYCRHCGLGCIWLVDHKGEYNWTADYKWIKEHFEIVKASSERSLYGENRPKFRKFREF